MEASSEHVRHLTALRRILLDKGSLAVAFSGGVDSAVLLHAAHRWLGERAVGVLADSPSLPRRELAEARALAQLIGADLEVVHTDELNDPAYRANVGDRCYFCKSALFDAMGLVARRRDLRHLAFGEITDDLLDDRPGARAAASFGVCAPLREAGLSKLEVRRYAREQGLPVADKPSSACLASRIPVGTVVTAERLARVEVAEEALRELGFRQLRVRDHGSRARVELGPEELERGRSLLPRLALSLRELGFTDLELAAYRSPGRPTSPAAG